MSKPSKGKKQKVPKLTEEEYVAYLSALRELSEGSNPAIEQKPQGESGRGIKGE